MGCFLLNEFGEVLLELKSGLRFCADMRLEVNEEAQNDFYTLKDILINDYEFAPVEACGGFEVAKKKGSF